MGQPWSFAESGKRPACTRFGTTPPALPQVGVGGSDLPFAQGIAPFDMVPSSPPAVLVGAKREGGEGASVCAANGDFGGYAGETVTVLATETESRGGDPAPKIGRVRNFQVRVTQ